jgi:putative endonuclease
MTIARRQTGRRAEDLVAQRLVSAGWRLIERNARTRYGEIDLVAAEDRSLVFVEVKAAREGAGPWADRPELAVGSEKQRRLRRLAGAWLGQRRSPVFSDRIRFDVVGVTFGQGDELVRYEHVRDAF